MYWFLSLSLILACKPYRVGNVVDFGERETLPVVTKAAGAVPRVYLVDPPPDSNADRVDVGVAGENAVGYRYALVTTRLAERRSLAQAIFEQPQLMDKLLREHGEKLFALMVDDPQVMQKIRKVGLRIIANKNFVDRIVQADGLNVAQVTAQVGGLIGDIEKLRKATDSAERSQIKQKITSVLRAMSANRQLMAAVTSSAIIEGDFLAKILREERIITEVLASDDFVNELIKYEEWKLLHQLVGIPLVMEKTQQAIINLLEDQQTLTALVQSSAIDSVKQLLGNTKKLIEQLLSGTDTVVTRNKVAADLKQLVQHKKVLSMLFRTMVGTMLTPQRGDPCQEADYSGVVSLDRRIIIEHLGEEGIRALCVKGEDEDGRQQPQPTTHSWEKTVVPSVLLSGELPDSVSDSQQLNIKVTASDNSLVGYRYQILSGEGNCPHAPDRYPEKVHQFTARIRDRVARQGLKLLCVFGVNSDNNLSSLIVSYGWFFILPSTSKLVKNPPRFDINTGGDANYWYPGDGTVRKVTIRNVGGGTLSWVVIVDRAIDWLEIRKEHGSWVAVNNSTDTAAQAGFISGQIPSDERQILEMRLTDGKKMSYGIPYYRGRWLTIKTLDSVVPISVPVRLYVPRLHLERRRIEMHAQALTKKIKVNNKGAGYLQWGVVALASPLQNWLTHTSKKFNKFTTNDHTRAQGVITFTLNPRTFSNSGGLGEGSYQQKFIVFSNGDATGVRQCTNDQKRLVNSYIQRTQGYASTKFDGCRLVTVKVTVR